MHLYFYVTIAIVLLHWSSVNADYDCVCNNGDGPRNVMNATDERSLPIGNINVGSCFAQKKFTDQKWLSLFYKHQVGYILNTTDVTITTCAYDPRPEDLLTTQVPMKTEKGDIQLSTSRKNVSSLMSSTASVKTPKATVSEQTIEHAQSLTSFTTSTLRNPLPTSPPTVLTFSPVTTETLLTTTMTSSSLSTTSMNVQTSSVGMSILKGHVELCPHRIQQLAAQSKGDILAQFKENCYEVNDSSVSWLHAETICKQHGGHLIHIANQEEQDFVFKFIVQNRTRAVWLGLNDRYAEEKFEWSSGDNVTYENWKFWRKDFRHHNAEDCVFMNPTSGKWDDIRCGGDNTFSEHLQGIRLSYICQYAITTSHNQDGHIDMCSHQLREKAQKDKGILAQHNRSCYELVPQAQVSWHGAKEICISRGGHLVYIESLQEQTFVQSFIKRHYPDHAVWIGLTDSQSEGRFQWASGTVAKYTNWVPGSTANFNSSIQEDCVVLIPYKNGQWDDVPCGQTHHFILTSSSGETHPLLCEYSTYTGPSFIG